MPPRRRAARARVPRTRSACIRPARQEQRSRRDTNEPHAFRDNARKSVNETSTLWADRRRLRRTWLRLRSALILRPLSGHIAPAHVPAKHAPVLDPEVGTVSPIGLRQILNLGGSRWKEKQSFRASSA